MAATTSQCHCGDCRRFCLGDCALPRAVSDCEHFEHYGQWLRRELARVERHHRQTLVAAMLLAATTLGSLGWVMLSGYYY